MLKPATPEAGNVEVPSNVDVEMVVLGTVEGHDFVDIDVRGLEHTHDSEMRHERALPTSDDDGAVTGGSGAVACHLSPAVDQSKAVTIGVLPQHLSMIIILVNRRVETDVGTPGGAAFAATAGDGGDGTDKSGVPTSPG